MIVNVLVGLSEIVLWLCLQFPRLCGISEAKIYVGYISRNKRSVVSGASKPGGQLVILVVVARSYSKIIAQLVSLRSQRLWWFGEKLSWTLYDVLASLSVKLLVYWG